MWECASAMYVCDDVECASAMCVSVMVCAMCECDVMYMCSECVCLHVLLCGGVVWSGIAMPFRVSTSIK